MELYIRKIIINESVYSAIEARLAQKQLLKYNFNRIDDRRRYDVFLEESGQI